MRRLLVPALAVLVSLTPTAARADSYRGTLKPLESTCGAIGKLSVHVDVYPGFAVLTAGGLALEMPSYGDGVYIAVLGDNTRSVGVWSKGRRSSTIVVLYEFGTEVDGEWQEVCYEAWRATLRKRR